MPMASWEPTSGWNLPPGCLEGDPRAPWNEPDPWAGRTCGECKHCAEARLMDGSKAVLCAWDPGEAMEEIEPERPAEECFEE